LFICFSVCFSVCLQNAESIYQLSMDHKEEMFDEEHGTAYQKYEQLPK
jgi:hypothetical protein